MLGGDTTQKGLAYQKAAKSIREAPKPIKSKDDARNLVGVGRCVCWCIAAFATRLLWLCRYCFLAAVTPPCICLM